MASLWYHILPRSAVLLTLLFAVCISDLYSQSLNAQDSTYLASLRTELVLSDSQYVHIDSVYTQARTAISAVEKEIWSISRSDMPQEERTQRQAKLAQEKKSLKELRDLDMQAVLTPEQKKIFEEKFRPAQNVIHFGVNHDRASCTVCLPK